MAAERHLAGPFCEYQSDALRFCEFDDTAWRQWSSLEYDGTWKALHYAAKRFYSPFNVFLDIVSHEKVDAPAIEVGYVSETTVMFVIVELFYATADSSERRSL